MPKKIISDMIVSKRSIRQIPISNQRKKPNLNTGDSERSSPKSNWTRKPINPKFILWLIAGICVLALFFVLSMIFSSATVIVTPKTQTIYFKDDLYTASQNSQNVNDLIFETLTINQIAGNIVTATEEKEVSQKASGKIIIYNNYSTASQRLINNTRFETKDGRIYRINTSVVVPGLTKKDDIVIPGSIEVEVYADQPGESYNLKIADLVGDFTIPGFKGDPRYNNFYARLKDDIKGGFIGKQRVVSDELREKTVDLVKIQLREQLLKELYAVKPENYLIFNDSFTVEYSDLVDTPVDKDKVQINIEGTLRAIVLNNFRLAKYLANSKITDFDALPVELISTDKLSIEFKGKDSTGLWKNTSLNLTLNGEVTIKWSYDTQEVKKDLAGKKENEIKSILNKYRFSILGIQIIFKPVWTRYIPDNVNKIKLIEKS